jgi:hypothetical protein
MPQQLSSLLLQKTVCLLRGLPSSPHFHKVPLKKEGLELTNSMSRSLSKHSMMTMKITANTASISRTVVGTVLLILNPLPIKALSELLGYDIPHIRSTIRSLHSLLLIPDKPEDPIHTFHKSFPDFLTDPERCNDKQFHVEPAVQHVEILLSCLNLMRARLKKNICNLDDHAVLSEVKDISDRKKDHIGDALEYACRFWTKHLLGIPGTSPHVQEVQKAIDTFFTTCLPYWIEVLALTGNLGVGVYAMKDVEQWCALVSAA